MVYPKREPKEHYNLLTWQKGQAEVKRPPGSHGSQIEFIYRNGSQVENNRVQKPPLQISRVVEQQNESPRAERRGGESEFRLAVLTY